MDYNKIIRDLKNKVYHPVYMLCGDEEYFIDKISDYIEDHVLNEGEKEFNQSVLYGIETDVLDLVSEAKRYPMMAAYNVVIVKEAQALKNIHELERYTEHPSPSTILVLNYKHAKPDGRKNYVKQIKKQGVFFESKRLYENQLPAWIASYLSEKKVAITPKATQMLIAYLGTDLSKISNEIDKLLIGLKDGEPIDDEQIEKNTGISKDYNVFELNNALGSKDVLRANRIVNHFGKNEKEHHLAMVLPMMYRFFSQLLLYHTVSREDNNTKASVVGVNPFFLKDFQNASRNYPVKKIARIISYLRDADLQTKGVKGSGATQHDILKELVFKILH